MKKIIRVMLVVLIVLVPCSGCIGKKSDEQYVSKQLDLTLPAAENIESSDTHGGFHGDGYYVVKIEFDKQSGEDLLNCIENTKKWKALPLEETLELLMYGGSKGGSSYAYKFAAQAGIPEIEEGYYLFLDRQQGNQGTSLLYRSAYNFSLAMYDSRDHILYYYEIDT